MAKPRSAPWNHCAIAFGAPMEMSGPPMPKSPTATNSVAPSKATARNPPDAPMTSTARNSDHLRPTRSTKAPQGAAATM